MMGSHQDGMAAAVRVIAEQLAGIIEESFRRHLEAVSKEDLEGMAPMEAATYIVAEAHQRATEEAGLEAAPRGQTRMGNTDAAWRMNCEGTDAHTVAEICQATGVSPATVGEQRLALEILTGSRGASEALASLTWAEARGVVADALGVKSTVGGIFTMRKVAEEQRREAEEAEQRRTRVFLDSPDWTATDTALRPKEKEQ